MDTKEFLSGKATDAYRYFGAIKKDKGYIFRVFAPNAREVCLRGDFNNWEPQKMRGYSTGVFSLSCKNASEGDRYQYVVTDSEGNQSKKIDPFAKEILIDENCALITSTENEFKNEKITNDKLNIYQVHLGSLLRDTTKEITEVFDDLIKHAKANNFTHISLMPVTEYKTYKSMGYAPLGHFALSNRYGTIDDFKAFIDKAHGEGLGIILEMDFAEFDPDPYYLTYFDGSHLYDYDFDDVRMNYQGSMNFDPSKNATKLFLKSVVSFWLDEFMADGIKLANIENMNYWQGDKNRGVNKDGVELLNELGALIRDKKAISLASFNGTYDLDLDIDYVFDNSIRPITRIFKKNPSERNYLKGDVEYLLHSDSSKKILGFNFVDAYLNEASLAMKMYGDWAKIDQLKSIFTFVYGLNSKKMLFMGDEIANFKTFSVYEHLDLAIIDDYQKSFNDFYKDLSRIYLENEALNNKNSTTEVLDIGGYSIYAFIRTFQNQKLLVISNFTDIDYNIKSPYDLDELINSHDLNYNGSGNVNGSINKNEKIRIEPFGAAIFKIK